MPNENSNRKLDWPAVLMTILFGCTGCAVAIIAIIKSNNQMVVAGFVAAGAAVWILIEKRALRLLAIFWDYICRFVQANDVKDRKAESQEQLSPDANEP